MVVFFIGALSYCEDFCFVHNNSTPATIVKPKSASEQDTDGVLNLCREETINTPNHRLCLTS